MTPEEEWIESSLRRDRERRMFQDMLKSDGRVRESRFQRSGNRGDWVIGLLVAALLLVGLFS